MCSSNMPDFGISRLYPCRSVTISINGTPKSIIFGSGRATLVMPHTPKRPGAFALDAVVVAWDFSRPAARAVADALLLLEKAKQVYVVTVSNEKAIKSRRSGTELAKHLKRHGVDAVLDTVDAAGRGIGDILKSYVTSRSTNKPGHGSVWTLLDSKDIHYLEGATKSMLSRPPVPVFLSH